METFLTKQLKINLFIPVLVVLVWITLMFASQVTVNAAPQHGFGTGQGRIDTVNVNDFHTPAWERFHFNYHFTPTTDHRFELGTPTSFHGFVPVDVHSVNIRRDANVSFTPPGYGIFSGNIPTDPSNKLIPQPVNPHFHQPNMIDSANLNPAFDTLQMGVNAQPIGNPMNFQQNVTTGEFLAPTSMSD